MSENEQRGGRDPNAVTPTGKPKKPLMGGDCETYGHTGSCEECGWEIDALVEYAMSSSMEERVVRAVAVMLAGSPRGRVLAGITARDDEPGAQSHYRPETDDEYAERLAKAGLEAIKGPRS